MSRFNKNPKNSKIKVKKGFIPNRLNLMFFVIFVLFVALIARLGYMQIMNHQVYSTKLKENTSQTIKTAMPRGQIYDSKGVALVSNVSEPSIIYTRGKNVSADEMKSIAQKLITLVPHITVAENLTERDKKDYWLATTANLEAAKARVSDAEKVDKDGNQISNSDFYNLTVEKVSDEEINFSEDDLRAASVFKTMNGTTVFNTETIVSGGLDNEDIAIVGENQSDLAGISTSNSWERNYNESTSLRSLLGTISTEKTGLPAEELEDYLAKGYARNDRVGTSYLEKQYETVLQGKRSEKELVLNNEGNIVSEKKISEGSKGNNLKLTIDIDFQNKVDEIITRWFNNLLQSGKATHSEGIYAVAINPENGAILAMSGVGHDFSTGKVSENVIGAFNSSFEPGSVVKGATLSAGYEAGVISGNDTIIDQPIYISGTPMKSSVFNSNTQIPLTATQSLQWSSNSYMMQIAIKMLGAEYSPNMVLPDKLKDQVYEQLRNAFGQYGMGVKTGIDLPNESTGQIGPTDQSDAMGKLLDLSFGQYDTYTALQLAQYASTVANGGTRYKAHLVEGIYDSASNDKLGDLIDKISATTLDTVPISENQMSLIRQGFYDVVHSNGYATGTLLKDAKLTTSAKTGTAETFAQDGSGVITVNSNLVAYAPSDNPKIAIGIMVPHLTDESDRPNQNIAKEIIDAFAELYKLAE